MTTDTPQNHYTEVLHPTKYNHWRYHSFDTNHILSPNHTETCWRPSFHSKGCRQWNPCYNCIALLLVDNTECMARTQLEEEYLEAPHPNPPLLCPYHFHYGTDADEENEPKRKNYHNWRSTKDCRVTAIAVNI
jgi:hypothetical protein